MYSRPTSGPPRVPSYLSGGRFWNTSHTGAHFWGIWSRPGPVPQTDLMWDCFGDRLGDHLGVVLETTIQRIATKIYNFQSNATHIHCNPKDSHSIQYNSIKCATCNRMQSTSDAIHAISTQPKQSNLSKHALRV